MSGLPPAAAIVVGAPRSGTTLLRFMLDAHPAMAIPPETAILTVAGQLADDAGLTPSRFADVITTFPPEAPTWADSGVDADEFRGALERLDPFSAAAGFRLFYGMYAARHGKPRWGDKTPVHALHVGEIARVLPEARFVHIVRDGRDAAVSLRQRWFSPGHDIEVQAEFWSRHVLAAREQAPGPDRYLEVLYEHLLADPERELSRICNFLELAFDPVMLRYYERTPERLREHGPRRHVDGRILATHEQRLEQQAWTTKPPDLTRIGSWRRELTADEVATFDRVAGHVLRAYGYETPPAA